MNAIETKDCPGVIAFPPLLWFVAAALSALMHLAFPRQIMGYAVSHSLGIACAIVSLFLALGAVCVMKANGTHIRPSQPALTIVRTGPFRFTRNPMYLALCLLQLALGFFLNDWMTISFVIPLALILHYGVILREERYLEAKFGDRYLALKRDVRRWV